MFDPLSPGFQTDPYPTYAYLREVTPILWHSATQLWYISRYDDVSVLLRDKRLGRSLEGIIKSEPAAPHMAPFHRLSQYSMFDKEPPDHTRLRSLVSAVFTPQRVHSLQAQIRAAAESLMQTALAEAEFDLLEQFAVPLPVVVIADLLGIPEEDRSKLRPWSAAIVAMFELTHTEEQEKAAIQAAEEFWQYLKWLSATRRMDPREDLISALAAVVDAGTGSRLSEEELIATCVLLLNAGHEATVNGFGNGMLALYNHPDQFRQLKAALSPSLVHTSVEEMLRYDTPLQLFKRWVLEDMTFRDVHFRRGEQVALFFGSANRDPQKFPNADSFDISRQINPHISFGAGIHYCLGAPLARLELASALEMVVRCEPALELAETPQWRDSFVIRGLKSLRVKIPKKGIKVRYNRGGEHNPAF